MSEPTRYEVALLKPGANSLDYLVGYTARKSKYGLINLARSTGNAVASHFPEDETFKFKGGKWPRLYMTGVSLAFTGRTEREAKQEGELPKVQELK